MDKQMLSFARPLMGFVMIMPLLLWWLAKYFKVNSKIGTTTVMSVYFPNYHNLKESTANAKKKYNHNNDLLNDIVYILLWLVLSITIMQPQLVNKALPYELEGYNIMVAVDLSRSMDALDFYWQGKQTTRIAASKRVVAEFVKNRRGDKVGLVAFAEQAYLTVPLTHDINSVVKLLNGLKIGMAGESTSIGDAIGIGIKHLQQQPGEKIIILLTDGSDTSSRLAPYEAAKLAQQYGIKVYTVGVGQNGLAPIRDYNGQLVMNNFYIDEKLLNEIADITNAKYAKATNVDSLNIIYNKINELEKSKYQQQDLYAHKNLYFPLMIVAIFLFGYLCWLRR